MSSSILRLAAQLARAHVYSTAFPAAAAAAPSSCRAAAVVQPTLLRNWVAAQMHSSSAALQEVQQQQVVQPQQQLQQQQQRPRPPDNAPMAPWTPTKDLRKRKTYTKRMGFMLQVRFGDPTSA